MPYLKAAMRGLLTGLPWCIGLLVALLADFARFAVKDGLISIDLPLRLTVVHFVAGFAFLLAHSLLEVRAYRRERAYWFQMSGADHAE